MYFACLECGEIFEEPIHWEEKHGFTTPPYEEWSGCPFCKGAYARTYKCDECGEYIIGSYIKTDDDKRICENCYTPMELGDED